MEVRRDFNGEMIIGKNLLDYGKVWETPFSIPTTLSNESIYETINRLYSEEDKRKEEKKMADANKILYIYEDIEAAKIRKHYAEKIEKVETESQEGKVSKKVREYATKELKKVFPDYDETNFDLITVSFKLTEESKKTIAELEKERKKELEKLDEKLREIKAMLDMTETFEQKMKILKAYNVVDDKGVMKK